MQYLKTKVGKHLIEFYNDVWGREIVTINGQEVSKKFSILGAHHFFSVQEDGEEVHFLLISKVTNEGSIAIDIFKEGIPITLNLPLSYGFQHKNVYKKEGLSLLKEYRLDEALEQLEKAENSDGYDAKIPLYMACIYSIKEDIENGYECLIRARKKGLPDLSVIDRLDFLAYLRLQPTFDAFKASGFTTYNPDEVNAAEESTD